MFVYDPVSLTTLTTDHLTTVCLHWPSEDPDQKSRPWREHCQSAQKHHCHGVWWHTCQQLDLHQSFVLFVFHSRHGERKIRKVGVCEQTLLHWILHWWMIKWCFEIQGQFLPFLHKLTLSHQNLTFCCERFKSTLRFKNLIMTICKVCIIEFLHFIFNQKWTTFIFLCI